MGKNKKSVMLDRGAHNNIIARMIRVDHAGECGAMRIYEGQMAVLKNHPCYKELKDMYEQELKHRRYFETQMQARRVRPTILQPVWHMCGYALGAATALLGPKGAMACTVAVEDAIAEHYQEQINALEGASEQDLRRTIIQFRKEEIEHRDIGLHHEAEGAPLYKLLYQTVQKASKLAIWLSKRI